MKKFIFVLILGIIYFTSCTDNIDKLNTQYILYYDGKIECIEDMYSINDSTAYYHAWQTVEIARCVETASDAAAKGTWLYQEKYHDYNFILWKITYTDSFKEKVEQDFKDESIYNILIKYLNSDNPNDIVKKYKLSLNTINYNLSAQDMDVLLKHLYEGDNSYYDKVYNKFYEINHR